MKKTLFTFFTFTVLFVSAQNVGINTTGATPHPSAALDVSATNKGLLAPRVADTNAVAAPAEGLLIYDNSSKCYRYRNNVKWTVCIEMGNPGNPLGNNGFNGNPAFYDESRRCNPFQASKDYDTVTTSLSGTSQVWITRNLGAQQDYQFYGDLSGLGHGCFFKHGLSTPYYFIDPDDRSTIYPGWTAPTPGVTTGTWSIANDPCRVQLGGAWRLPTSTEMQNVITNTGSGTGQNGINIFPVLKISVGSFIPGTGTPYQLTLNNWVGTSRTLFGMWTSGSNYFSHYSNSAGDSWLMRTISAGPYNYNSIPSPEDRPDAAFPVRCLR